jgi:hypothetical protein
MKCLDCARNGFATETIGICHHCSAGVCDTHGRLVSDPVTVPALVMGTRILPKRARLLFCNHCLSPLRQHGVLEVKEGWKPNELAFDSAVAERQKQS